MSVSASLHHSPALSPSTMSRTVILGCGIHGLSAAYALALLQGDGHSITIVDVANDACEGASGRPTAFLSGAHVHNDSLRKLLDSLTCTTFQRPPRNDGVAIRGGAEL